MDRTLCDGGLIMLLADLLDNIRGEMTALGLIVPEVRAYLLASAKQESRSQADHARATSLASVSFNPYGVKHRGPVKDAKYAAVTKAGNAFDKADGLETVTYRVYPSLREAVRIEHYNKFTPSPSGMYAATARKWGNGYPRPGALPMWLSWVMGIAAIHCQNNPDHVRAVVESWRKFVAEERTPR